MGRRGYDSSPEGDWAWIKKGPANDVDDGSVDRDLSGDPQRDPREHRINKRGKTQIVGKRKTSIGTQCFWLQ